MMTTWIMSIVGAICLTTLIDVLMDDGETKKFIKGISSIIVFAVIISPLPKLLNDNYDLGESLRQSEEVSYNKSDYYDFLYDIKLKEYSSVTLRCQSSLEESGISGVIITPHLSYGDKIEITEITVNLTNVVITENAENINIKELILKKVSTFFGVEESAIVIVG